MGDIAAPSAAKKLKKEAQIFEKAFAGAVKPLQEAFDQAPADPEDSLLATYRQNAVARLGLFKIWSAETMQEARSIPISGESMPQAPEENTAPERTEDKTAATLASGGNASEAALALAASQAGTQPDATADDTKANAHAATGKTKEKDVVTVHDVDQQEVMHINDDDDEDTEKKKGDKNASETTQEKPEAATPADSKPKPAELEASPTGATGSSPAGQVIPSSRLSSSSGRHQPKSQAMPPHKHTLTTDNRTLNSFG